MTNNDITIGTAVTFDGDHGTERGTVHSFKSDLSNGRRVALVRVPGAMNGEPWAMPVEQLRRATASA